MLLLSSAKCLYHYFCLCVVVFEEFRGVKMVICEVRGRGGVDPTRGETSEPPPGVRSGALGDSTAQIHPGEGKTEIKERGKKEISL